MLLSPSAHCFASLVVVPLSAIAATFML